MPVCTASASLLLSAVCPVSTMEHRESQREEEQRNGTTEEKKEKQNVQERQREADRDRERQTETDRDRESQRERETGFTVTGRSQLGLSWSKMQRRVKTYSHVELRRCGLVHSRCFCLLSCCRFTLGEHYTCVFQCRFVQVELFLQ